MYLNRLIEAEQLLVQFMVFDCTGCSCRRTKAALGWIASSVINVANAGRHVGATITCRMHMKGGRRQTGNGRSFVAGLLGTEGPIYSKAHLSHHFSTRQHSKNLWKQIHGHCKLDIHSHAHVSVRAQHPPHPLPLHTHTHTHIPLISSLNK
jgi:hypothetical protein